MKVDQSLNKGRRDFLEGIGLSTASALVLGVGTSLPGIANAAVANTSGDKHKATRTDRALALRLESAKSSHRVPMAAAISNGDEARYLNGIASFSKGMLHDENGLVDPAAYQALLRAIKTGSPADFDAIPIGSTHMPLVNPQGGLCYGMAGLDSCQFEMKPAPAFDSAERAGEHIECHWMALLRDVPFTEYDSHPLVRAACDELSGLSDFRGPKQHNRVTPQTVFRGITPGDLVGPYISQFLLQPIKLGAIPVNHKISTYLPIAKGGHDYLTGVEDWKNVQNGEMPMDELRPDPVPRHLRSARDLCAYAHTDYTYQAFFNASVWLANHKAIVNPGSPYPNFHNQSGFATLGVPDAQGMLASAHLAALRAVWYQKWIVHRTLRPEEFGGRVYFTMKGQADDPIHPELRHSVALARDFERTGSYLLSQAYPEGCPQHPSYAQGHAAIAGACATVLKAFYDGSTRIMQIGDVVESTPDGRALVPYRNAQAGLLTVGGELDKLAGNIAAGRNFAGIHWRSDYLQGILLGEEVAINLMRECRMGYTENIAALKLKKFDGSEIVI